MLNVRGIFLHHLDRKHKSNIAGFEGTFDSYSKYLVALSDIFNFIRALSSFYQETKFAYNKEEHEDLHYFTSIESYCLEFIATH